MSTENICYMVHRDMYETLHDLCSSGGQFQGQLDQITLLIWHSIQTTEKYGSSWRPFVTKLCKEGKEFQAAWLLMNFGTKAPTDLLFHATCEINSVPDNMKFEAWYTRSPELQSGVLEGTPDLVRLMRALADSLKNICEKNYLEVQ